MTRIDLRPLERDPGLREALEQVWSVLPEARLVGGAVRDLIAGVAGADIDLGVPAPPETVMRRLADASIRAVATGLAHGTVTALVLGRPIEITSLRRDERTDGRHAVVAWTEDWREDAQRRDFTINAMSLARDGSLFDAFGGSDDLAAGRVRFVGDAARRIGEDALRILRFFRFQARYGHGAPDAEAVRAIEAAAPCLDRLSAERVWSELRRILVAPGLDETLRLMRRLGVLDRLLPGGTSDDRAALVPSEPVLRLAAVLDGPAGPVSRALRLSGSDAAQLEALLEPPVPRPDIEDAALRRLLADMPAALLCGRAWLAQARGTGDPSAWEALRGRIAQTPVPVFPLAGRDVVALGIAPGPEVGRVLARIRAWWRAGGCAAGREACLARLHEGGILPPGAPGC